MHYLFRFWRKRMKKLIITTCLLLVVAAIGIALVACGETPANNNTQQSGYALNFNTVYALAEENGYTGTLEDLVALFKGATGEDGVDGVGIVDAQVNRAGELVLMLSNNQTLNLGSIVGPKGEQGATGNGIDRIAKTSSEGLTDTYTIYYTNGTTTTFAVTNGKDGNDGERGADGRGISNVYLNDDGNTVVVYTDGTAKAELKTFVISTKYSCSHIREQICI